MPLLSRMVGVPLSVDIRTGAVSALGSLLADNRISSGGRVAVAVGPGQGEEIAAVLAGSLPAAAVLHVEPGTIEAAQGLREQLRKDSFDAVVGIGGGRLLDTVKWAATLTGLPMVAVATNLAHDGIASPVASLEHEGRKASYGVQMPLAVVVDLDHVRQAPPRMRRSGIGDVLSNLSALADWDLAGEVSGEKVDGVAATLARTAALSVLHHPGTVADEAFLVSLAQGLVSSGLAMALAGTSRPCSGGCHEVVHAVDALFPGVGDHGELAGIGAVLCSVLRGDEELAGQLVHCLGRHGLPRTGAELGLTDEQMVAVLEHAPSTRPDRYTILEHLEAQGYDRARAVREVNQVVLST